MGNNTNQKARQERWKRYVHKRQKTHEASSNVHYGENLHQGAQLPYEYWDRNAKPKDKSEKFNNFLFNAVIIAIFIIFFAVSMIMLSGHTGGHSRVEKRLQASRSSETLKTQKALQFDDKKALTEETWVPAQVDDDKFSLTFPTDPTRKTYKGLYTEEYTAETDDSYVYVKKDPIMPVVEGAENIGEEDYYRYAIESTCDLVSKKANKTVSESDIERRSYNGRPAGYITFVDDSGNTVIATSVTTVSLFIKARTQERASEIFSTFQVK